MFKNLMLCSSLALVLSACGESKSGVPDHFVTAQATSNETETPEINPDDEQAMAEEAEYYETFIAGPGVVKLLNQDGSVYMFIQAEAVHAAKVGIVVITNNQDTPRVSWSGNYVHTEYPLETDTREERFKYFQQILIYYELSQNGPMIR